MVAGRRRRGLPSHCQLPPLPAHTGTHCITKISPTILPDTIINSVTAFALKRSIIPKAQEPREHRKRAGTLSVRFQLSRFFFFCIKIRMRSYSGTATNQCNSAKHGSIVYPGASLQHTLLPWPRNTDLQQFHKTLELGAFPQGLWDAAATG